MKFARRLKWWHKPLFFSVLSFILPKVLGMSSVQWIYSHQTVGKGRGNFYIINSSHKCRLNNHTVLFFWAQAWVLTRSSYLPWVWPSPNTYFSWEATIYSTWGHFLECTYLDELILSLTLSHSFHMKHFSELCLHMTANSQRFWVMVWK